MYGWPFLRRSGLFPSSWGCRLECVSGRLRRDGALLESRAPRSRSGQRALGFATQVERLREFHLKSHEPRRGASLADGCWRTKMSLPGTPKRSAASRARHRALEGASGAPARRSQRVRRARSARGPSRGPLASVSHRVGRGSRRGTSCSILPLRSMIHPPRLPLVAFFAPFALGTPRQFPGGLGSQKLPSAVP